VRIGKCLAEVEERMPLKFLEWIKKEFAWSEWSARRFMNIHRLAESGKLPDLKSRDLELDVSALYLIGPLSTPEPVREQAIKWATNGGQVTHQDSIRGTHILQAIALVVLDRDDIPNRQLREIARRHTA
jgi:hypothetical protein